MRATALGCAVLLVGCQRAKPDPRILEVKTPAHVTVRVIDTPKPVDCSAAADWREQFTCTVTPTPRVGCTYVEAGDDADAPLVRRITGTSDCGSLGGRRVMLARKPAPTVTLEFDAEARRAAVRVDADEWVLFLHRRQLLQAQTADKRGRITTMKRGVDGGVLWGTVPPLLAMVPLHVASFTDAELDELFLSTPDAQRIYDAAVASAVRSGFVTPDVEGWDRVVARLDDDGREQLRAAYLELLRDGEDDALTWLEEDKTLPRATLVTALDEALRRNVQASPMLFDALFRLEPELAAAQACGQLQTMAVDDLGFSDGEGYGTSLALIAKYKVKCPWVAPMLEGTPCDPGLRRTSFEDEDDTQGDIPLATEKEKARALKLKFTPVEKLADDEEDFVSDDHAGWLLLAAADAQGPYPETFVKRNARRTYRRVNRFAGNVFDDPCIQTSTPPAEWACRMPLSLTTMEREGCRLDIDDATRTLTLTGTPGFMAKKREQDRE